MQSYCSATVSRGTYRILKTIEWKEANGYKRELYDIVHWRHQSALHVLVEYADAAVHTVDTCPELYFIIIIVAFEDVVLS
jgi:hypothetical protein